MILFDILLVLGALITLVWLGIAILGSLITPAGVEGESHLVTQMFFIIAFLTIAGLLVKNATQ